MRWYLLLLSTMYSLNFYNFPSVWDTLATFSLVGDPRPFKNYMDNCYGFKIPKDEVTHYLPLAAIADIAEPALGISRDHEVNFEESESKS